jgi:hypothetical protein
VKRKIERVKRKRPENLDAYDLVLRALPHVFLPMPAEAAKAMPLLERALTLVQSCRDLAQERAFGPLPRGDVMNKARKVIAYHEAGHAVVARVLGVAVDHVIGFSTSPGALHHSAGWQARDADVSTQQVAIERTPR